MQLEIIMLSEVSQKERDIYQMISFNVESEMWHRWTYIWNRNRLMDARNRPEIAKGKGLGVEWSGMLELADVSYYMLSG